MKSENLKNIRIFADMLINEQTRDFIRQHENDDVRRLALQGTKDPEVDLMVALQQIAGRQTARRKLPSWAAVDGLFYPPHLNMEQCSSEQTARYKASLLKGGQQVSSTVSMWREMRRSVPLLSITSACWAFPVPLIAELQQLTC